jgi:hypothetical protein
VVLSDIWPWAEDQQLYNALSADDMRQLTCVFEPGTFAIVCSPLSAVLDLALPILMECCPATMFVHVPSEYLTNAPAPRLAWLAHYDVELILNDVTGGTGRRCSWLCILHLATRRST